MARSFNINAALILSGPANLKEVTQKIRTSVGNIKATIDVKYDPKLAPNITKLNAAFTAFNTTLANTTSSANSAASALGNLSTAVTGVKTPKLNTSLNATTVATAKVKKVMTETTNAVTSFGHAAGLAVRRFAGFSLATGIILGFGMKIKEGISAAIDFQHQIVRLAQIAQTSTSSMSGLSSTITKISTTMGVSAKSLIEVSDTLIQAGLSATDTKYALEGLAKTTLAPTFDDLGKTTEGLIALMAQFNISARDSEKALDAMNTVAAKYAVESQDIITAIKISGGAFATMSKGVSEGQQALNEFMAVFTSVRATTRESAESIATGMRTIFTRLARPQSIETFKQLGVSLTDINGKFVGAYEAINRISIAMNSMDVRDVRFFRIAEILGGYRQINKVIPILLQTEMRENALRAAQQSRGSLTRDQEKAQQSWNVQLTKTNERFLALIRTISQSAAFNNILQITIALTNAFIRLGEVLAPVIPYIALLGGMKIASKVPGLLKGFGPGIQGVANILHKASGGSIGGSGESDSVPAMLTPGEYVINKKAVKRVGKSFLDGINKAGRVGHFAGGALIPFKEQLPIPHPGVGVGVDDTIIDGEFRRVPGKSRSFSGGIKRGWNRLKSRGRTWGSTGTGTNMLGKAFKNKNIIALLASLGLDYTLGDESQVGQGASGALSGGVMGSMLGGAVGGMAGGAKLGPIGATVGALAGGFKGIKDAGINKDNRIATEQLETSIKDLDIAIKNLAHGGTLKDFESAMNKSVDAANKLANVQDRKERNSWLAYGANVAGGGMFGKDLGSATYASFNQGGFMNMAGQSLRTMFGGKEGVIQERFKQIDSAQTIQSDDMRTQAEPAATAIMKVLSEGMESGKLKSADLDSLSPKTLAVLGRANMTSEQFAARSSKQDVVLADGKVITAKEQQEKFDVNLGKQQIASIQRELKAREVLIAKTLELENVTGKVNLNVEYWTRKLEKSAAQISMVGDIGANRRSYNSMIASGSVGYIPTRPQVFANAGAFSGKELKNTYNSMMGELGVPGPGKFNRLDARGNPVKNNAGFAQNLETYTDIQPAILEMFNKMSSSSSISDIQKAFKILADKKKLDPSETEYFSGKLESAFISGTSKESSTQNLGAFLSKEGAVKGFLSEFDERIEPIKKQALAIEKQLLEVSKQHLESLRMQLEMKNRINDAQTAARVQVAEQTNFMTSLTRPGYTLSAEETFAPTAARMGSQAQNFGLQANQWMDVDAIQGRMGSLMTERTQLQAMPQTDIVAERLQEVQNTINQGNTLLEMLHNDNTAQQVALNKINELRSRESQLGQGAMGLLTMNPMERMKANRDMTKYQGSLNGTFVPRNFMDWQAIQRGQSISAPIEQGMNPEKAAANSRLIGNMATRAIPGLGQALDANVAEQNRLTGQIGGFQGIQRRAGEAGISNARTNLDEVRRGEENVNREQRQKILDFALFDQSSARLADSLDNFAKKNIPEKIEVAFAPMEHTHRLIGEEAFAQALINQMVPAFNKMIDQRVARSIDPNTGETAIA
jgi:TP901 family phage tail tape measure protein